MRKLFLAWFIALSVIGWGDLFFYQAEGLKLSGTIKENIYLSDCDGADLTNIKLAGGYRLWLAGCDDLTINGLEMGPGSDFQSFPRPVARENMAKDGAWWAATNGAVLLGDNQGWKRTWTGGRGSVAILVPRNQLKAGLTPENYMAGAFRLVDSAGKEFNGKLVTMNDLGEFFEFVVNPRGTMAPGVGYWNAYDLSKYQRNISIRNVRAAQHETFALYCVNGLVVRDSIFVNARVDYNFGVEYGQRITLQDVTSYGNSTAQGGSSDLAFLFGVRGLNLKNVEAGKCLVASNGWEVDNVRSDSQIVEFREPGWLTPETIQNAAVGG